MYDGTSIRNERDAEPLSNPTHRFGVANDDAIVQLSALNFEARWGPRWERHSPFLHFSVGPVLGAEFPFIEDVDGENDGAK